MEPTAQALDGDRSITSKIYRNFWTRQVSGGTSEGQADCTCGHEIQGTRQA